MWPLAFLVTGFGAAPRRYRAVGMAAIGLTLSSIGLLQVGWGLVMVLNPEYTVGWYFPARTGEGRESDDAAEALDVGRRTIVLVGLFFSATLAIAAAMAHRAPKHDDPEEPDEVPREEPTSVALQLVSTAVFLMGLYGVIFWVIALGIGLISMIQYEGVRQQLANEVELSSSPLHEPEVFISHADAILTPAGTDARVGQATT